MDTLAERPEAGAQGAIPKGRGFETHRCHWIRCVRSSSANAPVLRSVLEQSINANDQGDRKHEESRRGGGGGEQVTR